MAEIDSVDNSEKTAEEFHEEARCGRTSFPEQERLLARDREDGLQNPESLDAREAALEQAKTDAPELSEENKFAFYDKVEADPRLVRESAEIYENLQDPESDDHAFLKEAAESEVALAQESVDRGQATPEEILTEWGKEFKNAEMRGDEAFLKLNGTLADDSPETTHKDLEDALVAQETIRMRVDAFAEQNNVSTEAFEEARAITPEATEPPAGERFSLREEAEADKDPADAVEKSSTGEGWLALNETETTEASTTKTESDTLEESAPEGEGWLALNKEDSGDTTEDNASEKKSFFTPPNGMDQETWNKILKDKKGGGGAESGASRSYTPVNAEENTSEKAPAEDPNKATKKNLEKLFITGELFTSEREKIKAEKAKAEKDNAAQQQALNAHRNEGR